MVNNVKERDLKHDSFMPFCPMDLFVNYQH